MSRGQEEHRNLRHRLGYRLASVGMVIIGLAQVIAAAAGVGTPELFRIIAGIAAIGAGVIFWMTSNKFERRS